MQAVFDCVPAVYGACSSCCGAKCCGHACLFGAFLDQGFRRAEAAWNAASHHIVKLAGINEFLVRTARNPHVWDTIARGKSIEMRRIGGNAKQPRRSPLDEKQGWRIE